MDDRELRGMTAMWANSAALQIVRFEEAMDVYKTGVVDAALRSAIDNSGGSTSEWSEVYADASARLTQRQVWNVGAERYFLLVALAQLRKCVLAAPDGGLPVVREHQVLRMLRDIDEHWEQLDDGRSLRDLRKTQPDLNPGAGMFWWNNKHVWFGNISLAELATWVEDVDRAVRAAADAAGSPIPDSDIPLLQWPGNEI